MLKRQFIFILSCALLFLMTHAISAQTVVTAAQVNGTWQLKNSYQENEFRILALGNNKLKVEFEGLYKFRVNGERMAHTGTGAGVAKIEGIIAHFKPEDAEEDCDITLRFARGKLIVKQNGICGFGLNVTAEGVYMRVNTKPKFDL